jgi:membrane protein DedA with SNARE-associated domain
MTLESLIDSYGYLAILVGTFLEGETILVLGGVAAKLGYLKLPWVIACAFLGTLLGDQLFFFLGRYRGDAFLRRHPSWLARTSRVQTILERHRIPIILGFRFLYGLRSVTPFVIGMSRVPITQFVLLNIAGAALWATVIGALGFVFGHAMELVLGDIRHYETELLLAVLLVGMLLWLTRHLRKRHKARQRTGTKD